MSERPAWITETEVEATLNMKRAIEAVEHAVAGEARGEAIAMVKTHTEWFAGTLHALGAAFPKDGFIGTKTWAHTRRGAAPLLILFDAENGSVRALIEAFKLGTLRTAAASGVATRLLSDPSADRMAIIGSGKQAFSQVEAVLAVRPIKQLRVFSPNAEHRDRFVEQLRKEFKIEIVASTSVGGAVKDVPIVTTVTRAKEPFLHPDMLTRGTHINAVGAILPGRAELSPGVVARCTQIVSDSPANARKVSSELEGYFDRVRSLGELVEARGTRNAGDDLTLLKSLGTGVLDLAVGIEVYRKMRV